MTSAFRTVVGISILAGLTAMGCAEDGGGPKPAPGGTGGGVGGTGAGTGGASSGVGGTGTGGTITPAEGIPITPTDGWVALDSNTAGIQGAMFSFSDATTAASLTDDFTGTKACISGSAAKVDLLCTPVAPATDCYGTYWGAAIGFNLNQPIDPVTLEGVVTPLPFDASALTGFGFTISGSAIPVTLRFKIENADGEFCNVKLKPVLSGVNVVKFADLVKECWVPGTETADLTALTKIAWQVTTVDSGETPFDFCVSDIVATE